MSEKINSHLQANNEINCIKNSKNNFAVGNVIDMQKENNDQNIYAMICKVWNQEKYFFVFLDDGSTFPNRTDLFCNSIESLISYSRRENGFLLRNMDKCNGTLTLALGDSEEVFDD